jgi:septum formation protein
MTSIILGSSSPRRRDLLATVRIPYEVIKPDTPEIPHPGEAPEVYAARNAREKAEWVERHLLARQDRPAGGWIVVTADTIVVLDGRILEKPRDKAHAEEMVASLGGRAHTVVTGVELRPVAHPTAKKPTAFISRTSVKIKPLSAAEVRAYVETGEPLDKAGGYAAQGIGSYMVQSIDGSYANVVGLPIAEVVEGLARDFGYDIWKAKS